MKNKVIDLAQREQAIRPGMSFIVQAPAGSGKTELLIQRYLNLLATVDAPEEIVAITFTRKAAAEMRRRVLNALESAHLDAKDEATKTTRQLAEQAIIRAQERKWQLADNPGRLRIQTIDSLCAFLTRQMPILAKFGAQPETVDDASELYQQAAANTLAEIESGKGWSNAIAVLLQHLDNDLPRVRNMLASMLARRDQWLRHIARQHQREELEAALLLVAGSSLKKLNVHLHRVNTDDFLQGLQFAATQLGWKQAEFTRLPDANPDNLTLWQDIVELCLTQKDEWRKTLNKNQGFPAGAASQEIKKSFQAVLNSFSQDDSLLKLFIDIRNLPPVAYTDAEWQVVDALYQLLILADAQLRLLFAERNQIDFGGITQAANQALGTEDEPSDLALHLDYKIKHILFDEFQDISINQYLLLERLTAGWTEQDGHTLFLVGDPMQSIYRFREAEVGLFLNTWQQARLGQLALTPLNITVNFRSQQGIVDWVNQSFQQILPDKADLSLGAVHYVHADAFHLQKHAKAVHLHPLFGKNDKQEASKVLELIQADRQQNEHNTIAVLVRNRSHLLEIVPELKREGLRFRAVEIERLGRQAAIQDLLALTQAMNHFADRIAWLAMLRAPWCGLSLSDLMVLGGDRETTIWECMQDGEKTAYLSDDGQQRVSKIKQILQRSFAERGRRRLSRWVESVWMNIGGPATLQDETDLENTQLFFQLLDQYDQGGEIRDRRAFLQQVMELFAAADVGASNELQIMTIHKAKGLEFDTVILPGLSKGSGVDESSLLMWMELPHETEQALLLAPVKAAGTSDSPIYNYLKRLERDKQRLEEGRLLYVAATRAKKQLHMITSVELKQLGDQQELVKPRYNSLLSQLWPLVKKQVSQSLELISNEQQAEEKAVVEGSLKRLSSGWQLPPANKSIKLSGNLSKEKGRLDSIEFEWASETIRHVGSVVHRYIQRFAEDGVAQWDRKRLSTKRASFSLALKRLGVTNREIDMAVNTVETALGSLCEDERGRWILDTGHDDQHNEYAISGVFQSRVINVVIDRTFIDEDGTRWIIDYKTSRHEGADKERFLDHEQERYAEQLNKYAALISCIEDRPIKLGLYFPLLRGWREWSYAR